MDFDRQLRVLQAARNNPSHLALAMVDITHHALSDVERLRVKDALIAAAVPHWCDSAFLATLLKTTQAEGEELLSYLRALTVIESFPARGKHAVNVHESTRFALRDFLRTTDPIRWDTLSNLAIEYVSQNTNTYSRIEALYHLFAIDQHKAIATYETLAQEFLNSGNSEAEKALALVLAEPMVAEWFTEATKTVARVSLDEHHKLVEEATQEQSCVIRPFTKNTSRPIIQVLLMDDHEMVRRGLRALLHLEPDITIVGEAGTVGDGVVAAERLKPQLVLLDVRLPDASVTEACQRLLSIAPKIRILVLTSYASDDLVMAAVRSGAHGYVLKDIRMDDLLRAIRTVAAGHGYLDPRVTRLALPWIRTSTTLGVPSQDVCRLSTQERLILPLLAEGKTNREIASQLRVSDKMVKNYLANIFEKRHFKRRSEAVAFFTRAYLEIVS